MTRPNIEQYLNTYGEVVHLVGDDLGDVGMIVRHTMARLPSASPRYIADLVILSRAEAEVGSTK